MYRFGVVNLNYTGYINYIFGERPNFHNQSQNLTIRSSAKNNPKKRPPIFTDNLTKLKNHYSCPIIHSPQCPIGETPHSAGSISNLSVAPHRLLLKKQKNMLENSIFCSLDS